MLFQPRQLQPSGRLGKIGSAYLPPFTGDSLKRQSLFPLLNGGLNLHPLLFRAGVRSGCNHRLCSVAACSCFLQAYSRIFSQAQRLALPLKGVIHAPELPARWRKEEVQAALVIVLRLVPLFELSQVNI